MGMSSLSASVLGLGVAAGLREATFRAEKIPRHALDGGDVDERVARLRRGQVFVRQHLRIERLVIAEVLLWNLWL